MATALLGSVIQPSSKFATAPELFLPKYQFCKNNDFSMKHSNNMSSGVCCIISTSTCSATVSTNTTYIRNPGWFKIPSINILWHHQECDNILMIIITCLPTTPASEIQGDLRFRQYPIINSVTIFRWSLPHTAVLKGGADFRYPSTYTPSSTGTCVFTISKVSSEVCQVYNRAHTLHC